MRFRLSAPAKADLEAILQTSGDRWGAQGRDRYAGLIASALHNIAAELLESLRSLHLRHVKKGHGVRTPVHVIYYRHGGSVIEIVRVLHERMDPSLHIEPPRQKKQRRRT